MTRIQMAAAAAALAIAGSAHAGGYAATVTGSGLYQYIDPYSSVGVPGGCNPAVDPLSTACQVGIVDVTWTGALDVVTAGSSGTFTDASGIKSITLTSNLGGFSYAAGDGLVPELPGEPGLPLWLVGLVPGASVTIEDGRIVAFDAVYNTDVSTFTFSGMSAIGQSANPSEDSDGFRVNGGVTSVPEAPSIALFALGLGVLALRRIAPSAGRCSPARSSS